MYIKNVANQHNNYYISNKINTKSYAINNTNEVLGYKVDKDGYFTAEFNKAANIPEDIKIHSSTMQSLVDFWANKNTSSMIKTFENIDIAKTIGNAYKILSQLIDKDTLDSKANFTLDEIKNLPQGYEFNRQSLKIDKIINKDYENTSLSFDYNNNNDIKTSPLFFSVDDIFNNNNKKDGYDSFFDTTADKYTNTDGSITKGGLLVAIINANMYTIEGETTRWGKRNGFDKSMNLQEVRSAWNDGNVLKFDPNNPVIVQGAGIVDKDANRSKDSEYKYTDPLTQIFEDMQKDHKELLERLEAKRKEEALIQAR
ncbi:Cj0814 family flagellar-dependent secreted protein, partial [Campylobacter avium]